MYIIIYVKINSVGMVSVQVISAARIIDHSYSYTERSV
jgi:hypothetical protein